MGQLGQHVIDCGGASCLVTDDRRYQNNSNVAAFLFYGSHINVTDLPLPKTAFWGLFHEESPKNVPFLSFHNSIELFDYTATFSRFSRDIPLTLQHLPDISWITDRTYHRTIEDQNALQKMDKLAPILYLQSNCDTLTERDEYVRELRKYIPVHSFGRCLNDNSNKTLPGYLTDSSEAFKFMARYKFMIAYENAVCEDYITEKLWRPIRLGVVPIYFGATNIRDWLPNPKSAILIEDFESPQKLADYIKKVNKDDKLYNQYLEHKLSPQPISNNALLDKIYRGYFLSDRHQSDFECQICSGKAPRRQINPAEYKCILKYPPGISPRRHHPLREYFLNGKCEAKVLRNFISKNVNYTKEDFDQEVRDLMLSKHGC